MFTNIVFCIVTLMFCLEPDYLKSIASVNRLFRVGQGFVLVSCILRYLLSIKRMDKSGLYLLAFFIPMLLSTLSTGQSIGYAIRKVALPITCAMLVDCMSHYNKGKTLAIIADCFAFNLFVAFITYLLKPNGLLIEFEDSVHYKMYYLGIKNGLLAWITIAIVTSISSRRIFNTKWRTVVMCFSILISVFLTIVEESTTCLICLVMMLGLIQYDVIKKRSAPLRTTSFVAGYIFAFFSVVVFRLHERLNDIFNLILGKDATLTGRTNLWDMALALIKDRYITGYGIRENSLIVSIYGRSYSAHNLVLETLLCGGIVSLIVLITFLWININRLESMSSSMISRVLFIGMVVFLFGTLTETGVFNTRWAILFAIIYNCDSFDSTAGELEEIHN